MGNGPARWGQHPRGLQNRLRSGLKPLAVSVIEGHRPSNPYLTNMILCGGQRMTRAGKKEQSHGH